ncbi:MAG: UvrD-helicase domain-containing protein [Deltaproteobacteria bacterium]|nr:UvrD-helicase domain-containing protein [Deltaproteobacteria bacterium]
MLHNEGALLVLAGAGSGKTRALIRKIAWLVEIERLAPWEILAVTFTNKAAAEMRERAAHLLGERADALWLGTFHAIGVRLLRQHGPHLGLPRHFVIYDDDDQETLVGRCLGRLGLDAKAWPARNARAWIDRQKQLCMGPDHPAIPRDTLVDKTHAQVYEVYQQELAKAGAVDFGDLIWLPWRLATEIPEVGQELRLRWRAVLVDEFQDTNRAQYMLLRSLLAKGAHLCVVGDDDQSIYRWRGAEVDNILKFPDDFPGTRVVRFEQNYRSTGHILDVAGAIIAQNRERHGKTLWTDNAPGERVRVFTAGSDGDEAEWVVSRIRALRSGAAGDPDGRDRPLVEHAIFYRTHAQSRAFEDRLRAAGLPYRVYGGLRFYDRAEIKDVVAYLKLVTNPEDGVALERIINRPTRGIGKGTLDKIVARAERDGTSLWAATCGEARDTSSNKLIAFVELVVGLREAAATGSALDAIRLVLERSGYLEHLVKDGSIEAETRAENVRELVAAVAEMGERRPGLTLAGFLDEVALVSGHDEADDGGDAVIMMTAHMAKGLEFDVVFATGLEDGLMPHANSIEDPRQMEEERRLVYVALTRARRHLHISWAQSRRRFGQSKPAIRSRFLDALPRDAIVEEGAAERPRYTLGGWSARPDGRAGEAAPRRQEGWEDRADPVPSWEDESQDPDAGALRRGARVFHPSFGQGRVEGVEGQGERAKVSVRFADGVTRKLLARAVVLA